MEKDYLDTPLWNSSLSEQERLDYLLKNLTLEEKFECLGTGCPAIERLGIPAFFVGGEGAHGVQARNDQTYDSGVPVHTTILPNPIGMSATWDEELIKEAGRMVGNEARGLYQSGKHRCLSLWAPTVDMERDPRWGRTEEGYGEDPCLAGRMAGAYVEGLQGDDPYYLRCAATLKHYYANNVEEGRTYTSSSVDLRNKHEYYLAPFRRIIKEHHAEGMMTAYNEINGIPCMLLKEEIRLAKQWGLGHVVCDGGDVNQTVNFHKYFSRHSETLAAGLEAEIDCFTDGIELVSAAAREAYEHKMITMEQIDRALRQHFRVMLRLGLFERPGRNPYANVDMEVVGTKENHELVRKVTAESVVLLKNEDVLPVSLDEIEQGKKRLAVVGPLSDVWFKDWYSGIPPYAIAPADGIRGAFADNEAALENVAFEDGVSIVKLQIKSAPDKYLGILEDGKTIGAVEKAQAEEFQIDFWGDGKITLRACSNGLLLTTEDDESRGQGGEVCAVKEEAFGWFVREIFYLTESGELRTWDKKALCLDENGILKKSLDSKEAVVSEITSDTAKARCVGEAESLSIDESVEELVVELCYKKDGIAEAAKAAKEADTVLLYLGANPMITCKEEIDRQHIDLPEYQEQMLRAVCNENKKVVLVLVSSVPYNISWAKEHTAGIVVCATGSMELGNGIADIVFGKESPAGRLNMTWYRSAKDLPPMEDYDIIQQGRTYQYYDGEVLYPFGHGLTYSEIAYKDLSVKLEDYTSLAIRLSVSNTGACATDEVVQIYYTKKDSVVKRARRTLIAFKRVKELNPGETRELSFRIPLEDLKYFDVISEEMLLEPGEYEVFAGASSEQLYLSESITLRGMERERRNGLRINKAECFDRAKNHVLRGGHLSYASVCTKNGKDMLELHFDKMHLEKSVDKLLLDFWKEYPCHIWIEADGKLIGECKISSPVQGESQQLEAGQATGEGAFEAHQNWITKRREIGFAEQVVPVSEVPVGEEFTLTIRWQGKGKLCAYQFLR